MQHYDHREPVNELFAREARRAFRRLLDRDGRARELETLDWYYAEFADRFTFSALFDSGGFRWSWMAFADQRDGMRFLNDVGLDGLREIYREEVEAWNRGRTTHQRAQAFEHMVAMLSPAAYRSFGADLGTFGSEVMMMIELEPIEFREEIERRHPALRIEPGAVNWFEERLHRQIADAFVVRPEQLMEAAPTNLTATEILRRWAPHPGPQTLLFREQWLTDNFDDFEPHKAGAVARGEQLLKEWLSPKQLADFEANRRFCVTGCHTGTRYQIRHGVQQNVFELDAGGNVVCGWCFAPAGSLVPGDVMLAQKVALETNERAVLAVANKFGVETAPFRSGIGQLIRTFLDPSRIT